MTSIRWAIAFPLFAGLLGCQPPASSPPPETRVHRGEVRFGLTFEDRMAVPPALSRLRADAHQRAAEIYDPTRSRESAIRNEEYFAQALKDSRAQFLASKHLTEQDADEIEAEYRAALGANLR